MLTGKSVRLERAVALVLLIAFVPTLSFLGHWDEIFGGLIARPVPAAVLLDAAAQRAEQAEHSRHCHTELASCSAQPLPAGLGLLATRDTLLRPPLLKLVLGATARASVLLGRAVSPPSPPPRLSS